jgi:hypothetical protein
MASMIRFPTTIKVGNPRLTRRCVRSSVEFYMLEQTGTGHERVASLHRRMHAHIQPEMVCGSVNFALLESTMTAGSDVIR